MNKEKLIANWSNLKDETKAQILELADKEIKEEYFVPKEGEIYYTYNICISDIIAVTRSFSGCGLDNMFITVGNCFRTHEEAIFAGWCDYYTKRFETYVNRRTERLDWQDFTQQKYRIFYYCRDRTKEYQVDLANKAQGAVYASSRQILREAIADIGEDNFLKYVMKVEK